MVNANGKKVWFKTTTRKTQITSFNLSWRLSNLPVKKELVSSEALDTVAIA